MKSEEREQPLSPEEQAAFAALPRERMPAASLENKIVQALKAQGLLRLEESSAAHRWPRAVLLASAAAVCLLFGFFLGTRQTSQGTSRHTQPLFVLLLYGGEAASEQADEQVREYGAWINSLAQADRLASGEKLKESGRVLQRISGELQLHQTPLPQSAGALGGYFIIAAANYEEALKIAQGCPHLKYGGVIELREIDPT